MTLQVCVKCNELGMTWHMDGDDRTWWHCSECEFEIEEDETKEGFCGKCNHPFPMVSWLIGKESFFWCFSCNERVEKTSEIDVNEWVMAIHKKFSNES